jgi:hypothetical protein
MLVLSRAIVAAVLGALALFASDAGAQTYRWLDEKGVVHYAQGLDNVPERYRDPRLSAGDRGEALDALRALKELASVVVPEMGGVEYQYRLRRLDEVVGKALRAMRRSAVATALGGAQAHYRHAGPIVESGAALGGARPAGAGPPCERLARLPASGEPGADRAAALRAVWGCASEQIARAESLMQSPGGGPWATRVPTPPKPRK